MMKRNDGFTLIELIISISIGTIITAAALSILLFGMRINLKTTASVQQVNATNMMMQLLQKVAEEPNIAVKDNQILLVQFDDNGNVSDSQVFVKCDGKNILLNNTVFMEDVCKIAVTMNDKNLLTMQIWIVGNTSESPDYTTSVYYRMTPTHGGSTQ